jgi:hypothetical protein
MSSTRRFLVCIHDATPAHARATEVMIRDLAPLVGRRLSFGVVPDWHGAWPLAAHPDYCALLRESADELLLHGFFHRRARDQGLVTWLTDGSDEMNGLNTEETRRTIERGQRVFTELFGEPARGFLAPAWQQGHVHPGRCIGYVLGFFSLDSRSGQHLPLATSAWDCGRWGWPGHIGDGIGRLLSFHGRIPSLALHPRDLERGYWPRILALTHRLVETGYEPSTPAELLEASDVEVHL